MKNAEALSGYHLNVLIHGQQGPEHKAPVPAIAVIKGITEKGNTFIQLRDKGMSDEDMIGLGIQLRQSLPPEIPLIINDRVAVALAIRDSMKASASKGILGIHVGQKDMFGQSIKEIREQIGEEMILGVSAATVEQAKQAVEEGADYLGVGPLFPTASKDDADLPIGLRGLAEIREALPDIPIIAIGGITQENAEAVMKYGANGIAVISAVLEADDPTEAAEKLATIVTPRERVPRLNQYGEFTEFDDDGDLVGRTMSRKEAETTGTSPVVSVLLFSGENDDRRILLQQRAHHKSRWAGEWEGSIVETGRTSPNDPWEPEDPRETGKRGLKEELGITNVELDNTAYSFIHTEGGATSIITVYTVQYDEANHGPINYDKEEVADVDWVPVYMVPTMIAEGSKTFTQGFQKLVAARPELFS